MGRLKIAVEQSAVDTAKATLGDLAPAVETVVEAILADCDFATNRRLYSFAQRIAKMERETANMKRVCDLIDAEDPEGLLDQYDKRLRAVTGKIQIFVSQNCVLTEIYRARPDLIDALMRALEHPDSWWRKRKHLTIGGWIEELSDE